MVIPLVVMLGAILGARCAGALGVESMDSWQAATRTGLAVMFVFTAAAHFNRFRGDLIRMVPPQFPKPGVLVTLTGMLELVGAVGLLLPSTSYWAAMGLIFLLVALFPANVHAARSGLTLGGRLATRLVFRLPLQVLWIGLLWWVAG